MIEVRLTFNLLLSCNNLYILPIHILFADNTILESEGKLYVDNVHLKLNNSDSASSNGLPVDIYEQITENVKISSDNLHETCSECFQKIEDAPLRNCIVAVSPNRIRRRRLSRQFSA